MAEKAPHILLINPWIYDFAAHDLWSKPLGLLVIAGLLRMQGFQLRLLDCLDIHDSRLKHIQGLKAATRRSFGTGKFYRMEAPKPPALAHVDRSYYRFGITSDIFDERLLQGAKPDLVLLTCCMTYWYPGVQESIRAVKKRFPGTPVVLGGIYATLCPDHASRHSGADCIISGPGEAQILPLLEKLTGRCLRKPAHSLKPCNGPLPAFDLLDHLEYVCLLTSRGCPLDCPYCASALLYPGFVRRDPMKVVDELEYWHAQYGVVNFAFYDDALLLHANEHVLPMLAEVRRRNLNISFHTPNAVHISALRPEVCEALFASGFKRLRLGLETADAGRQQQLGAKVQPGAFSNAMANLARAGFPPEQIGVYLLCGLPGQDPTEVARSIRLVKEHGARPHLAEYSPIPGTRLWWEALKSSPYNLADEPLYHNNSILPCQSSRFGLKDLQWLKHLCKS